MIVKNEERALPQCLSVHQYLVDEIIVVDTGSTDQTKTIASSFGARVFEYEWTQDFSAARNFSLQKATCGWILILDADEIISPIDHSRLRNLAQTAQMDTAFTFITRNYVLDPNCAGWIQNDGSYPEEEVGTGWIRGDKVRLFRNDTRIYFEYRVHERVEPSLSRHAVRILPCDIVVHHYGFLKKERDTKEKGEMYVRCLEAETFDGAANDPNRLYHIAIELSQSENYREALRYWEKLRIVCPHFPQLHYYLGNTYFHLGRYKEALEALRESLMTEKDFRDAIVMCAQAELCAGDIHKAIFLLKELLKKEPHYPLAHFPLAIAYFCLGKKEKGIEHVNVLRKMNFGCSLYFTEFARILHNAGRSDFAIVLLKAAVETGNVNETTMPLLRQYVQERKDEEM